MEKKSVSIIIPTLNEEGNIEQLVDRISKLFERKLEGELIFIDDHSRDKTLAQIRRMQDKFRLQFPIRFFLKKGQRGKAQSLLEGFSYANFDVVAIIDADLQYPPEAIAEMVEKISEKADIIVANRKDHETSFLRFFVSKFFSTFFGRLLHGLDCDVQSGLKVFRKKIINEVILDPTPWTFDLEFLLSARNLGYKIDTVDIKFDERLSGDSKVKVLKASFDIGWNAILLKFKGPKLYIIEPEQEGSMVGAGIVIAQKKFVTHSTLDHDQTALHTFKNWQKVAIALVLIIATAGLIFKTHATVLLFLAFINIFYFVDVIFNLFLVIRSLDRPGEIKCSLGQLKKINQSELPTYTILCPLYKEAHMLEGFVAAMDKLHWPKDKLEVLLLLEENDPMTIKTAEEMQLPHYVKILVVPHSLPKTKPKACNYGLSFSHGEYTVIYDAEDIPDPWQLLKAYLAFQKTPQDVICLQAKLNYFNPNQNLLTRLFAAEYSLWFDVILTGLQTLGTSIPLGGTSNHFRTSELLKLKGWDPFNVTEDCDLGTRLFMSGYKTAIIDSVTLEEANSEIRNWLRQRSRWIKGYMQTYLVQMRNPWQFFRKNGIHALIFQFVIGGKISSMIINPLLWLMTIFYFTLYEYVGATIQSLFPPAVFYIAVVSLVLGNFLYLYYYMIGCAKRGHYGLIKYVFLVPFYWLMVSIAAAIATYQLFIKPHYWEKTNHGLHLNQNSKKEIKKWKIDLDWIKNRLPKAVPTQAVDFIFSKQGFFIVAMVISNLLNFIFNAYLARALSYAQFSLVILMSMMWSMATIFIGGFAGTVNHRAAFLIGRKNFNAAKNFLEWILKRGKNTVLACSILWVIASPGLGSFFNVDSNGFFLLFVPAMLFGLVASTYESFFKGNLRFVWSAIVIISEALSKLLFSIILTSYGKGDLAYISIPLSLITAAIVGSYFFRKMSSEVNELKDDEVRNYFPTSFFFSSILTNLTSIIFLSLDVLLVRHFFSEEITGQYSILSSAGKMIYFLGTLPLAFMIPYVSLKDGLRQKSKRIFRNIFLSVFGLVTSGFVAFGALGFITVPLLFGEKSKEIVRWLPLYSLSISIFALANVVVIYHLARRKYLFSFVSISSSVVLIIGFWLMHENIFQVVRIFFIASATSFVLVILFHLFERNLGFLNRSVVDFWGIMTNGLPKAKPKLSTGRRILIFNWRDITHSFAGGAEIYVHQIAKKWVSDGNHVTIFCGNDGKQIRRETIDGIDIVRRGGFYLVYAWAFLYYIFRFRNKYDIIIDCENGIPFFTPLYVRKPIFSLLHHVHQDVFFHSLPLPLAVFASFLEKDLMPLVYRNIKFITVSESSKIEMENIGIGKAGITVVNPGIEPEDFATIISEKTEVPTILYLGRLKAYKSVNVLIQAYCNVVAECPEARLLIAGKGDEEKDLKRLIKQLGLNDQQVCMLGRVSEKEKIRLLQSSWVLVNPSFMEGWGIVAIEACACGTPVIASNVPGLRDSVQDGKGGYLLPYGDVSAFAKKILKIIQDREHRIVMGIHAKIWAENFSWEKTSSNFMKLINDK